MLTGEHEDSLWQKPRKTWYNNSGRLEEHGGEGVTSRLSPKMIEKNYALFSSRMFFALSIFKLKSDFKHKSILSRFQYFHKHVYVYFSVWSSVKVAVSHCKVY